MPSAPAVDNWLLPKHRLDDLIGLLLKEGFEVIGPRIEQGAIVYSALQSASDLPIGWTDRQAPGSYRLEKRPDNAYFGFAVGPHSWKARLFPPELSLWQARKSQAGFEIRPVEPNPPKQAFLGVRSCELHAMAVQDRVFINRAGQFTDPYYAKARERVFLIAVECEHPAGTCFCVSMGTGPEVRTEQIPPLTSRPKDAKDKAEDDSARIALPLAQTPAAAPAAPACDLVMTELEHDFVVRATTSAGASILERLRLGAALPAQLHEGQQRVALAAQAMGRKLDVTDVQNMLQRNQEHPRWDDVAGRCLACTNCTLVCPTCFCSDVRDVSDLTQETAERVRHWGSCFNPDFAQVHGGNFRPSIRARYRQWLTHKFASWFDQFDVSGCVGCGRCITWCPVGIDVTEEIGAIRATDGQLQEQPP